MEEKREKKSGMKKRTKKVALTIGVALLPIIGFSSPIETIYEGDFYLSPIPENSIETIDIGHIGGTGNFRITSVGMFYLGTVPSEGSEILCTLNNSPPDTNQIYSSSSLAYIDLGLDASSIGIFAASGATSKYYINSSDTLYLSCNHGDGGAVPEGNYSLTIIGYALDS